MAPPTVPAVDVDDSSTVYVIPDTLSKWPWRRRENVYYEEAREASSSWLASFGILTPKALKAFMLCNFELLSSLAYPTATLEQLRVTCDLMQLFFVFDDFTDCEGSPVVRAIADAIMDGMRYPDVQQTAVIGEISRQFWIRTMSVMHPETQLRFIEAFQNYTDGVVEQAQDREIERIRDITEYFDIRRKTIGTWPCFVMLQLGLEIPACVFEHPTIFQLETHAADMIIIGNDLYSYNVEQARGDDSHNIVTIVRNKFNWPLDRALRWIGEYHDGIAAEFLIARAALPSFGEAHDIDVTRYVDGLGNWVRANEMWSFESHKYFGKNGRDIQKHRRVVLLPRKHVE